MASKVMFRKIENPFDKPSPNVTFKYILDSVFHLLDSLSDKDDQVKTTAEASLIKIADKKPDEVILFVSEYKKKNPKLTDQIIAVILR
jgi:ABC-type Fe3+-hydroxamate transport system substrate-binding protein